MGRILVKGQRRDRFLKDGPSEMLGFGKANVGWIQCQFQRQNDATWASKNGNFAGTILQKSMLLGVAVCLWIFSSKNNFLRDGPSKMLGFERSKVEKSSWDS